MPRRKKISTTISPEGYNYLRSLVRKKRAANMAEAVDLVLQRAREEQNREELERATAAFFDSLSPEEREEENRLGEALSRAAEEVNFDE
jgi:urease accessory protein UreF